MKAVSSLRDNSLVDLSDRNGEKKTALHNGSRSHHIRPMQRLYFNIRAYFIARGVKSALKEVEQIQKGTKKPKSLDQLLNEL